MNATRWMMVARCAQGRSDDVGEPVKADVPSSLLHVGWFAISAMTARRPETTRAIRSY